MGREVGWHEPWNPLSAFHEEFRPRGSTNGDFYWPRAFRRICRRMGPPGNATLFIIKVHSNLDYGHIFVDHGTSRKMLKNRNREQS